MADEEIRVIATIGSIVLTVPPVVRVPGGDVMPCWPRMFVPHDATTGELLHGVLVVTVHADAKAGGVYADLTRIAKADGTPAETTEEVIQVAKLWGVNNLPRTVQRFTVNGFELGTAMSPTFDPSTLEDDVDELRRRFGLGDDGA